MSSSKRKLRINFVMPPCAKISGGPLAIIEYANRLHDLGHKVSITTYSDLYFEGDNPFPWAEIKGQVIYEKMRAKVGGGRDGLKRNSLRGITSLVKSLAVRRSIRGDFMKTAAALISLYFSNSRVFKKIFSGQARNLGFEDFVQQLVQCSSIQGMPDCDLNIATWWMTCFPVLWSRKGKPVYFMQHYEEVFYQLEIDSLVQKLMARVTYDLPMYKIANSSWLQSVIREKHDQDVPFSNNGIVTSDFQPRRKPSLDDGIVRVVTYSRPEIWKGFLDAAEIMRRVFASSSAKVEWHVFGYVDDKLPPENKLVPYEYHPKLSFAQLSQLYAESDIALCPSWYESFPLPPLEAMACGTAVVTTTYGTEDYAKDEVTALTYKPRDIAGGTRAVMKLLADVNLRQQLAERGYRKAQEFDWNTAVKRREALLYDIFNENVGYDRLRSADHGLRDGCDRLFSQAPHDLLDIDDLVIKTDGTGNFTVKNGRKKFVGLKGDARYVDPLRFMRIPNDLEISVEGENV